ncbi:AzlD domain-containing protein [Leptotrichia sp. OH3620_COT-345]|uniref:AzlD domain-containing protein n=1 Tax=Leptotrichia sp. OH3620_COT-345 TaxID=2491048 RepID=UPI000F64F088|nr:AzlD domain-containing protein [Leptotrichia sp. OH3620_COT-345]RRD39669.1 AzlD domain-containing protein [Leptotrichia sp. OH3620_COT-345]
MSNFMIVILILATALITAFIKLVPLFIKIPENNPIINKFFEALPYTVLTILIFPGIFTSTGTDTFNIIKVLAGIGIIVWLSLKKFSLGVVVPVSIGIIFLFDIIKFMIG